jgi:hypothetical protein
MSCRVSGWKREKTKSAPPLFPPPVPHHPPVSHLPPPLPPTNPPPCFVFVRLHWKITRFLCRTYSQLFCRSLLSQFFMFRISSTITESRQSARLSLQSSKLAPPAPSPASECCTPPPLWFQEEGYTRLRERGWRKPIPMKGQTLWFSTVGIL